MCVRRQSSYEYSASLNIYLQLADRDRPMTCNSDPIRAIAHFQSVLQTNAAIPYMKLAHSRIQV